MLILLIACFRLGRFPTGEDMFCSVMLLRLSRMQGKGVYTTNEVITSVKQFEYFRTSSPDLEEVYCDIHARILFSDFSQAIATW